MENVNSNNNDEPQVNILQKSTYRVEGGTQSKDHGKVEHGITTNSDQGIVFYEDGNQYICVNKTSTEVVGHNADEKTPAKVIFAKNGDIEIRAPRGQITLVAKHVRIISDDVDGEVTINSTKTICTNSPNFSVRGTSASIVTSNNVNIASGFVKNHGENTVENTAGPDVGRTSFLGKLMGAFETFKSFFN